MERGNNKLSIVIEEDEEEAPEGSNLKVEEENALLNNNNGADTKSGIAEPLQQEKSLRTTDRDLHLHSAETRLLVDDDGNGRAKASYIKTTSLLGNGNDEDDDDDDDDDAAEGNNRTTITSVLIDEEEESNKIEISNYFNFLDDYIRFDISRKGISCFSGYSISVQYEDDFLVGKEVKTSCFYCCCCCNIFHWRKSLSLIRLRHAKKTFELEYFPKDSCTKPKNCVYRVKVAEKGKEIGTIHFRRDLVHIYNASEKCYAVRRKHGANCYSINKKTTSQSGSGRLAMVELVRGMRGDIMYYGLSILGDASSADKALLIGLTIAMDIRRREADVRCSLFWMPLCCILVIILFSLLPWLTVD